MTTVNVVWRSAVRLLALLAIGAAANAQDVPKLPEFAVASVKQNNAVASQFRWHFTADGVRIENASLLMILRGAFEMFNSLDDKFIGVPGWARTEKFDVEAKVDSGDLAEYKKLSGARRQQMVQALLTDRFKLQAHHEKREQPMYVLLAAKGGVKLQVTKTDDKDQSIERLRGKLTGRAIDAAQLAQTLTQVLGRTVEDRTRLTGKYDFTLEWRPEDEGGDVVSPENAGASIFTAIEEQLGLKLEATKGPVEVLVIDHLERPTVN